MALTMINRSCPTCKVEYGLPLAIYEAARTTGADWWCPNGHRLHFPRKAPEPLKVPPEVLTLRAENNALRARVAALEADCACALEMAEAESEERRRLQHRLTGAKWRARNVRREHQGGVCPWCHQSFENLRRHLAARHEGFREAQRNIA